jgi:prepilin peptidase CpaA
LGRHCRNCYQNRILSYNAEETLSYAMSIYDIFFLIAMVAFTATCFAMDFRIGKIPNWLTVPMFVLGILFHLVLGGFGGLGVALLGFAAGFGVLLAMMLIGAAGGGDVKMMGAIGAWLGFMLTIKVFVTSAVVALALSAGLMIYTTATKGYSTAKRRYTGKAIWEANAAAAKGRKRGAARPGWALPYAVPLAIATWIVLAFELYRGGGTIVEQFTG